MCMMMYSAHIVLKEIVFKNLSPIHSHIIYIVNCLNIIKLSALVVYNMFIMIFILFSVILILISKYKIVQHKNFTSIAIPIQLIILETVDCNTI